MLEPVLHYGILKERMSALITDAVRANLLESKGYETQILEFIDMEHTPKNLLIRAVKSVRSVKPAQSQISAQSAEDGQTEKNIQDAEIKRSKTRKSAKTDSLYEMMRELNIHPTLERLLCPDSDKGGTL